MKSGSHLLFAACLLIGIAASAMAADPVVVAFEAAGDPVPSAIVTVKAVITINDGSTLQSVKWTQTAGIPATAANTTTDTITITIPERKLFKDKLLETLEEPPIANAPVPYEGGLQHRFGLVGISPHALTDAVTLTYSFAVTTSSGTYKVNRPVVARPGWETTVGIRNVPLNIPVILNGKKQDTYNWTLTAPAGSAVKLTEATTQYPEFIPDVPGEYNLAVTDLATNKTVNLAVFAGTWKGMVAGTDPNGNPLPDPACMKCHVPNTPHFDLFTPWAKSGHAEIFIQNVTTPNGHYAATCIGCHTVGYNATAIKNGGIDDAPDFEAFLASGLLTHGESENWNKIVADYPATAKLANIQCENCHGPQDSPAHMKKDGSRKNLSSEVCGSCHGEPPRHGRYQQWQISKHANYETAVAEGTDASCSKCHSAQGFVAWSNNKFSTANLEVTWTTEDVHPVTCATCHDPHSVGTTSGNAETNAQVRVSGKTPLLLAGFTADNVGTGAICMTCHNGRRGLRNDSNFTITDASRAPHVGPQADIIMGQNLYFAKVGTRGNHSMIPDTCVTCHMESTTPPAALSMPGVGTNHEFGADNNICVKCHTAITTESVQGVVESKMVSLETEIETALETLMQTQIRMGNAIDLGGQATIKTASDIAAVEFIESHGRQGVTVTLSNGTKIAEIALNAVKVVPPAGNPVELYAVADQSLPKAGWNYVMVESDKSKGVHNPAFVNSALDISLYAVKTLNATSPSAGGGATAGLGGGVGNGAGAVSCTTPYVYWAEIAGHAPGAAGSEWRTDIVARNLSPSDASLTFYLHQTGSADLQGTGTVFGGAQKAFEDIVANFGGQNTIGSLEICSDRPLLVAGRIFNQAKDGTYGQNLDGRVADLGYSAGKTVNLIGLRQKSGAFRSNISVTNGGTTEAQVAVVLYDATGKILANYNLAVPASKVFQDIEPFKNRANVPDVDWGFATVTVLKGTNVLTSASLIDAKTSDPTTIPAKQ